LRSGSRFIGAAESIDATADARGTGSAEPGAVTRRVTKGHGPGRRGFQGTFGQGKALVSVGSAPWTASWGMSTPLILRPLFDGSGFVPPLPG
jgi:hypothetical protein